MHPAPFIMTVYLLELLDHGLFPVGHHNGTGQLLNLCINE